MTVYPIAFTQYLSDYEQNFSGWDFAWISDTGRIDSEPLDWSYVSMLTSHMEQLYSIHLHMASHGYFDVRQDRFLLIAERGYI